MKNFLLILFLIIFGCKKTDNADINNLDNKDSLTSINKSILDSLDLTIIKYDSSYYYIFPTSYKSTELTNREILECENLLIAFIIDYNRNAINKFYKMEKRHPEIKLRLEDFTIELKDYGRQYMGVVSNDGEKIILVNCFCNPQEHSFRNKSLVDVEDGGNCYFQFKVNLKDKRIFDFIENSVS